MLASVWKTFLKRRTFQLFPILSATLQQRTAFHALHLETAAALNNSFLSRKKQVMHCCHCASGKVLCSYRLLCVCWRWQLQLRSRQCSTDVRGGSKTSPHSLGANAVISAGYCIWQSLLQAVLASGCERVLLAFTHFSSANARWCNTLALFFCVKSKLSRVFCFMSRRFRFAHAKRLKILFNCNMSGEENDLHNFTVFDNSWQRTQITTGEHNFCICFWCMRHNTNNFAQH